MDYSKTLNLPKTDFPMRANLPEREPEFLKFWDELDIYRKVQEKNSGPQNSSCMTVLPMPTGLYTWATF